MEEETPLFEELSKEEQENLNLLGKLSEEQEESSLFEKLSEEERRRARALAHKDRQVLISLIYLKEPIGFAELKTRLDISPYMLDYHLNRLEKAELIKENKTKNSREYKTTETARNYLNNLGVAERIEKLKD